MKPEHLKQLIDGKRQWTEPLSPDEQAKGFKGWYSSKYLPHFDSPGTQQFISYHLADSMPAARRSEWEALLHLEDDLERQRKVQAYLDRGMGELKTRRESPVLITLPCDASKAACIPAGSTTGSGPATEPNSSSP